MGGLVLQRWSAWAAGVLTQPASAVSKAGSAFPTLLIPKPPRCDRGLPPGPWQHGFQQEADLRHAEVQVFPRPLPLGQPGKAKAIRTRVTWWCQPRYRVTSARAWSETPAQPAAPPATARPLPPRTTIATGTAAAPPAPPGAAAGAGVTCHEDGTTPLPETRDHLGPRRLRCANGVAGGGRGRQGLSSSAAGAVGSGGNPVGLS